MSIIDTFDDKTDAVINPSQIAPPITDGSLTQATREKFLRIALEVAVRI